MFHRYWSWIPKKTWTKKHLRSSQDLPWLQWVELSTTLTVLELSLNTRCTGKKTYGVSSSAEGRRNLPTFVKNPFREITSGPHCETYTYEDHDSWQSHHKTHNSPTRNLSLTRNLIQAIRDIPYVLRHIMKNVSRDLFRNIPGYCCHLSHNGIFFSQMYPYKVNSLRTNSTFMEVPTFSTTMYSQLFRSPVAGLQGSYGIPYFFSWSLFFILCVE